MTFRFPIRLRFLLLSAFAFGAAVAETVSLEQAQLAVGNWLKDGAALGCRLGSSVESARTCQTADGVACHVVKLAGRGFVVTSADTKLEPVVAFSDGDDLVADARSPLWALLQKDLAARARAVGLVGGASLKAASPVPASSSTTSDVDGAEAEGKWARLLASGPRLQSVALVSDLRVEPLVGARWYQEDCAFGDCYNYSTPNNYACGCVATAAAQIMRHFEWPAANVSVAPYTCKYCYVDGKRTSLTTQGGCYDWSQMPLLPDAAGTTEANRRAIGKLTSDIGIICAMDYSSGGSGTGSYMLQYAFAKFGYSNVITYQKSKDLSGTAAVKNALLSNLDAKLPVVVSIADSDNNGHSIVGDGYGYSDGTLYIHFNFGWAGDGNAWYAPPDFNVRGMDFSVLDGFVYNIYTNQAAGSVLCSGRVLAATGAPVAGAVVTATRSGTVCASAQADERGIYALYLPASAGGYAYSLTASYAGASATASVTAKSCTTTRLCDDTSAGYGSYYPSPAPTVGNLWGTNFTLSAVSSVAAPVFSPADCLFYPSTNVTLSCPTAGATIRYTLDGSDPTESSPAYDGAITVEYDAVIKAKAFKDGLLASVVVSAAYVFDDDRGPSRGDLFALPFGISGESGSFAIDDNSKYTLEDNEPLHTLDENYYYYNQAKSIWYRWTAPANGTVVFTTKCSKLVGSTTYRRQTFVAVYQGGTLATARRLAYGDTVVQSDYSTSVELAVEAGTTYMIVGMVANDSNTGAFTLSWSGRYEYPAETSTSPVPVPYAWLDARFPGSHSAAEYEALANADPDGDGFTTCQEYLLGTDPTNSASFFIATIRMEGQSPVVEWCPSNANLEALGYRYVPRGRSALDSGEWQAVSPAHRFFKIFVEPK